MKHIEAIGIVILLKLSDFVLCEYFGLVLHIFSPSLSPPSLALSPFCGARKNAMRVQMKETSQRDAKEITSHNRASLLSLTGPQ